MKVLPPARIARRERGRVVVLGRFAVAERQADALNTACLAHAERRDGAVAVGADLGTEVDVGQTLGGEEAAEEAMR